MRVATEREGGRVVAERPTQGDEVRAFAEMDGGEGVAKGVEPGPGSADLLDQRLQYPLSEIVGVERASAVAREDEAGRLAWVGRQVNAHLVGKRARKTNVATPPPGLWRTHVALDQGSADADFGCPAVQLEVQTLERDRLADPEAAAGQQLE